MRLFRSLGHLTSSYVAGLDDYGAYTEAKASITVVPEGPEVLAIWVILAGFCFFMA